MVAPCFSPHLGHCNPLRNNCSQYPLCPINIFLNMPLGQNPPSQKKNPIPSESSNIPLPKDIVVLVDGRQSDPFKRYSAGQLSRREWLPNFLNLLTVIVPFGTLIFLNGGIVLMLRQQNVQVKQIEDRAIFLWAKLSKGLFDKGANSHSGGIMEWGLKYSLNDQNVHNHCIN